ncbi:MAG TPA: hypothetical protein VHD31_00490 [Candidatus Paceibacterota bacterium]|nr:hypothetical protein [Candidatus Paceibacterota bacterium]
MRHNFKIIILLGLIFLTGSFVRAQSLGVDPVRYITNPDVPGPNQLTTMEVQGVGTFLGDATITWQVNGKTVLSGVGQKTFSFTTGDLGVTTRVHVVINSSIQGTITNDFVFTPTRTALFWEADTSVPPLYRGKALYTAGSSIKVVAFPQVVLSGGTVTANNLSFQWKLNGDPVTVASGKGHNTFTFQGSQLRSGEQVDVDIYFGSSLVGQASVFIPAVNPGVLFYNKDPLRGVLYDQAFPSTITLVGKEITLLAAPYYFANESLRGGTASFAWTLNGDSTSGPNSDSGILTLRQAGNGAGQADVSVEVQNTDPKKFVQDAQAALRIMFGGQTDTALSAFGL